MTSSWPSSLQVRELTSRDAEDIAAWRYGEPWTLYDGDSLLRAEDGYWAVAGTDQGPLVGLVCVGFDARVPGLPTADDCEDVGVGMKPGFTGSGHGQAFGTTALAFARSSSGKQRLRAVVQSWNTRSLRLCRTLGFSPTGVHTCVQGGHDVEYIVLIADLSGKSRHEDESCLRAGF